MNATPATKPFPVHRHLQLFLLTALVVAAMLALRPAQARPSAALRTHSGAKQVTVVMKEFRFILSTRSVHTGAVVFRLVNRSHLPHDFKINGHKTKLLSPGQAQTLKVTFLKAGKYPYLCTVTGHAAAGMKGTFTVT